MNEKLTNVQVEEFLKDFEQSSETFILEEGKEQNEIFAIAKAKGINLKDNKDLAGFKTIYTFADKANRNNARLPKKKLLKALPSLIGKPVDIDHIRHYVVGHYIDYRYKASEDMVIAYGVFYKSNFGDEWKEARKLFKSGKLATSYEVWCPDNKRKFLSDGTYELSEIEIAGGALLYKEDPAFKEAKVLELAMKNMENQKDLVFASEAKYKEEELITADADYFVKEVEKNAKKLADEKEAKKKAEEDLQAKEAQTPKKEPETTEEKTKPEELENKDQVIPPQPVRIKCDNCQEEMEQPTEQIKCPKCFAIIDKTGKMIYPPQIIDFKLSCGHCNANNWLLLENSPEKAKVRCLSCSKEFNLEFDNEITDRKELVSKINFLYSGTARCPQCGHTMAVSGTSQVNERTLKCSNCGVEFPFNLIDKPNKKDIKKVEEMKEEVKKEPKEEVNQDKPTPETVTKSSVENKSTLEINKFHRYIARKDYSELLRSIPGLEESVVSVDCECIECSYKQTTSQHCKDLKCPKCGGQMRRKDRPGKGQPQDQSKKLTYKERKSIPDKLFAVVVRVKNKKNGKIRKIRMFPINDEAHVRNALARLNQEAPKATLTRLGVSINKVRVKILKRAKELNMKGLVERYQKANIDYRNVTKKIVSKMRNIKKANKESEKVFKSAIRKVAKMLIESREGNKLATANLQNKSSKNDLLTAGVKKLASQVISLKEEVKKIKDEKALEVSFYKDNAVTIHDRRLELGKIAENLTDEEVLNEEKYNQVKLEKENRLLKAHLNTGDEVVGSKIHDRDSSWYSQKQKEVDDNAFGRNKKKEVTN